LLSKLPELRFKPPLELWGGIECTVNRVGDAYFDQLKWSGHDARLDDLDRFAQLKLCTLRYPILWERVAPRHPEQLDWRWTDERIAHLQKLDIRPIAGLLHHGSGPRYTSLLDASLPEKLAAYARAVARRYPHLEYYTPVNEPLTTARFSALYGHWFPHRTDAKSWARALLNQCRGVVLAMRDIRRINPAAQLVQTEDMGRTYSTRALAYQADFENERRWLSFDLLCGRVGRDHPLWHYLQWVGVDEREVAIFQDEFCPPDIIGLNYYLTSERFLDERLERYPEEFHGGNGRHEYADVAAVRVSAQGVAGAGAMLREAWERYRLPVAITEAHLGCTREEQVRWLWEVWNEAHTAREAGAEVRAVTVWSLLGAYNWNTLVTRDEGHYEPGVFDLRRTSSCPGPTALAHLVRDLGQRRRPMSPVLTVPGWWRQPRRLLHDPVLPHQPHPYQQGTNEVNEGISRHLFGARNSCPKADEAVHAVFGYCAAREAQPVLIAGATGTLGRAFARICELRHLPHHLLTRQQMDIADRGSVASAIKAHRPWAIINAAGYVRVDDAEREPQRCLRENRDGAEILALECAAHGIPLMTFSSDLVFDGAKASTYLESDGTAPLNVYGHSKAAAEARVLAALSSALVVRTGAFFGPWDEYNFVTIALREIGAGHRFVAASDAVVSPTYVPDLVNASLDLLIDGECGLWHLANCGQISWAQLACRASRLAGLDESLVQARATQELQLAAPRPLYSALGSERGQLMPSLDDALARYFEERAQHLEYVQHAKSKRQNAVPSMT
jgi:dTDP-4-dehydrorhamnose reductase